MCASCGFPAAPGHWTEAGAADPQHRLRDRYRREQVLRAVLPSWGLTAQDGGNVPGIQLSTLAGRTDIVRNLEELWSTAEAMCGRPIDPLDPRYTGEAES